MKTNYMFDTNIFNRILDCRIDINSIKNRNKDSCYATHIQIDEINNTKEVQRRNELSQIFHQIPKTNVPTESFVINISRLRGGKLSDGALHKVLLSELDAKKPKEKEHNIKDALIGETCIKNNFTLVTTDGALYDTVKHNGGTVLDLQKYLEKGAWRMKNYMEEYLKVFIFGIKLIVLLALLFIPPIIGFGVGSGVNAIVQKIHLLYKPSLNITAIQDFKPEGDLSAWNKIDLDSGKSVYYTTNRPIGSDEHLLAKHTVIEIINSTTHDVERLPIINKKTYEQKGIVYKFDSYGYPGEAIYGYDTLAGDLVIIPIDIVLTIICLALYFPLIKAIINLFKGGRVV